MRAQGIAHANSLTHVIMYGLPTVQQVLQEKQSE